MKDTFI